eukprot:CAMPEP_0185576248 /NCGR_PEP_ID=MMETSP0434-20130131/7209_1 /TAXON_ID=626734 ORGANISM="Favella taraikaensis, Strain Fe Narragansett Bay" /NCGR_SAMPLE_ID=MMETSP0434 /ASSEMBLY_ACC=CAM_ASM_000379 /LENGTH=143 /DNA_ID=CAMNT_0028193365 /DNA_START=451 /DNA_END=878 /DNA_ORIENTATION=+
MKDVKEGYYTTQTAGHIANNGVVDSVIDPWSGKIIRVEAKKPEKIGKSTEVIELPAHVLSGESHDGNAEQVYEHGSSPEDKKIRGEDEKILSKLEKQQAEFPPKKEEEGDGKKGDAKKGDGKKAAPAGGEKKPEEKKEGDKKP